MIVSFTGTQEGMTFKQMQKIKVLLEELEPTIVIHGDCIGADEQFHQLVCTYRKIFDKQVMIKIYPSTHEHKRAYCDGDQIMPQEPPLDRNKHIASEGDRLIACPKEMTQIIRSGTWTTVRKAKNLGKIVYVVLPNGDVK